MEVNSTVIVQNVPASTRPNGVTTLEIKRLTEQYCSVREVQE